MTTDKDQTVYELLEEIDELEAEIECLNHFIKIILHLVGEDTLHNIVKAKLGVDMKNLPNEARILATNTYESEGRN